MEKANSTKVSWWSFLLHDNSGEIFMGNSGGISKSYRMCSRYRRIKMETRLELAHFFQGAANLLHKMDALENQRGQIRNSFLPTEGGYKRIWEGMYPIGRKFLVFIACCAVVGFIQSAGQGLLQYLYLWFGMPVELVGLFWSALEILLIVILFSLEVKRKNNAIRKKNQANADRLEANKRYNEQLRQQDQALIRQVLDIYSQYNREYLGSIPGKYAYDTQAVDFFASAFFDGRADSLKEAINLYEQELFNRRIEQKMDAEMRRNELHRLFMENQAMMQTQAAQNAEAAAYRTEQSARNAEAAAYRAEQTSNNYYYY